MNRVVIFLATLVATMLVAGLCHGEDLEPGLLAEYFAVRGQLSELPTIPADQKPTIRCITRKIHFELPNVPFDDPKLLTNFYARWTGKIRIPETGRYAFCLESDDGSRLFLDGVEIITNDGRHGMTPKTTELSLAKGDHDLRVDYFQNLFNGGCDLAWQPPGSEMVIVPAHALFHSAALTKSARPLTEPPDESAIRTAMPSANVIQYSSRLWQTENGLPQNYVQALAQTRDGYLWVGTRRGLARFNGIEFKVFGREEIPGLMNASITALCETRDGSLWIGTAGELIRLAKGHFTRWSVADGLPNESVRCLLEDKDGALWIGTTKGLVSFSNNKFNPPVATARNLMITALVDGGTNGIICGTSAGIFQWKDGRWSGTGPTSLRNRPVKSLSDGQDGQFRVGSMWGLTITTDGNVTQYTKNEGLLDDIVNTLYEDAHGTVWIGTYGGLQRMIRGKPVPELDATGEPYGQINAILGDQEGNIWIGAKDGLRRLTPKRFLSYGTAQGLAHNNVMSVCEDLFGAMWIGTWGGGVNKLKYGTVSTFTAQDGLTSDHVLSIRETRDRSMWVGTDFDKGLFRIFNGSVENIGKAQGLIDPAIRVIYEDRQSTLWLGTRSALYTLHGGPNVKVRRFTHRNGLPSDSIRCIAEDHNDNVWIGTDTGLSRYRKGAFTKISKADGLSNEGILCIYEDKEGVLWVGTGHGLNRFENGKFYSYTTEQGLFHNEIFEILEDDQGWLWMSCPNGVFRVNKKTLKDFDEKKTTISCVAYGREDGLPSVQCNGTAKPAAWKSKDGRLWFATTKGLAVVNPAADFTLNKRPPPVFVESVLTDKQEVPSSEQANDLVIQPGRGELEFHYAALSYSTPEKNRFRYKLEGVDSDWVDAGTRRVAYYNNIFPGQYRFRVAACNNDGFWNETGVALPIAVLPHFWQTKWFISLIGLLAIGLVAGIARYITWRKLRLKLEKFEQQHALEKDRIRISQDMHDDLGARLTQIMLVSDQGKSKVTTGEMSVCLDKTSQIARDVVDNLDALVWSVNPVNDTLNKLVTYIYEFAPSFLQMSSVRCRFDVPDELPDRPLSSELRHNLFLAMKEALHNIVKHAASTEVWIRLQIQSNTLVISIEDNGKGFEQAALPSEFGNGLQNMERRMKKIGGCFQVQSELGKGTRIQLQVPMEKRIGQ